MTGGAPQTHSQPSRKTKRSWRKNVDLTSLEDNIAVARDELTQTGGSSYADVSSDALFQSDVTGLAPTDLQRKKSHPRVKVDEILGQRTATPAISSKKRALKLSGTTDGSASTKRRKNFLVSRAERERLRAIALQGAGAGYETLLENHEPQEDLWSPGNPGQSESTGHRGGLGNKKAPKSMRQPPSNLTTNGKVISNVAIPSGGRSYNPSFPEWSHLLEKVGNREMEVEDRRLKQAADIERFDTLQKAGAVAKAGYALEGEGRGEGDLDGESEYESEWEGIHSDIEPPNLGQKTPTRKTPSQRNKIKRRKALESNQKHQERMRERTSRFSADNTSSSRHGAQDNSKSESASDSEDLVLRRKRFGKSDLPSAPLELVLPEELKESLRLLKPEGNLLEDRFRNVMLQGRLESRKPVRQMRKPRRKMTEKWTYKDWKLPSGR